jgi:hypothetical protein
VNTRQLPCDECETGYERKHRGDCHLIGHNPIEQKLYETWRADITRTTTRKLSAYDGVSP